MAILNICANKDKMKKFKEYVDQFGKETKNDCETLKDALKKLQNVSSADELYQINSTIGRIDDIVTDAQPTIKQLSQNIDTYLGILEDLEKIAK